MTSLLRSLCVLAILPALSCAQSSSADTACPQILATGQTVHPAGQTAAFPGRPVDLVLSADGGTVYVKNRASLTVLDAASWKLRQDDLPIKEGCSMHGIALSRDGHSVYLTTAAGGIVHAVVDAAGKLAWAPPIVLPPKCYPCGIALTADAKHAYVALSRLNSVAVVDLVAGKMTAEIPVGVAPYDVVFSPDETAVYVSNWGGRRPKDGERTGKSSGTDVLVDQRGIPCSGTVGKIAISGPAAKTMTVETAVGLHPSDLAISRDGSRLFVANASSDTVSELDAKDLRVVGTLLVRPDVERGGAPVPPRAVSTSNTGGGTGAPPPEKSAGDKSAGDFARLPFGSITCGLALSDDGRVLFAANGGNNAVAVISLGAPGKKGAANIVRGFIPAGWFPSAVACDKEHLYIVNTKGDGPQWPTPTKPGWNSKQYRGTANRVDLRPILSSVASAGAAAKPATTVLDRYTAQVRADAMVPQILRAFEKAQAGAAPVPVPARTGEPSVFEHVVFVLKENRTYDQVFGDIKKGNGDANLCIYGREVSPNHHALAEQFALLDNYYCNSVLSADGHQWATQGVVTDYQEKTFGGWTRSYDFGSDVLTFAPTDFIWDNALLHGLTFRNYGEFDWPKLVPSTARWADVYAGKATYTQDIPVETLRPYTANYPGWNLKIPDAVRIERFLAEFREYEKKGVWPNFVFVYLPQDHTSGKSATAPTPRAYVADNDLALGKLVEAVSHSKFWAKTCIFVNEDDPQDGFDHVDGHRSLCLVVSPYTKRGAVVSHFYNQTSVMHTMERILGLPAMNQFDALAPTMEDCFAATPDLSPYKALPNNIPLDEMSAKPAGKAAALAPAEKEHDFSRPDLIDEDDFNRELWLAAKGENVPYPAEFAGAHGRGLKALGLKLQNTEIRKTEKDD